MKELVAMFLLVALVAMGWNRPYRAQFGNLLNSGPRQPAVLEDAVAIPEVASAPQKGSWMWEKGALDQPARNTRSGGTTQGGLRNGR